MALMYALACRLRSTVLAGASRWSLDTPHLSTSNGLSLKLPTAALLSEPLQGDNHLWQRITRDKNADVG